MNALDVLKYIDKKQNGITYEFSFLANFKKLFVQIVERCFEYECNLVCMFFASQSKQSISEIQKKHLERVKELIADGVIFIGKNGVPMYKKGNKHMIFHYDLFISDYN